MQIAMNVIADVPDIEDSSTLAAEFIHALHERLGGRIFDATFVVIADGGERFNLEELAQGLGGGD
jgi:hypothetical protein